MINKYDDRRILVTFVVISYNHERFIRQSINSAFSQTYSPLEIIISDDNSSDNSFSIIKDEADSYSGCHRVRINRNIENLGLVEHVNKIFEIASGDLIVVSSGDDISLPDRTSIIVDNYLSFGKPVLIHSRAYEMDEYGRVLGTEAPRAKLRNRFSVAEACISERIYLGASAAWSKKLFTKYGQIIHRKAYEDLVLGFRAILEDGILYIDKPLLCYRVGVGVSPVFGTSISFKDFIKFRKNSSLVMIETLLQRMHDLDKVNIHNKEKYSSMISNELCKRKLTVNLYTNNLSFCRFFIKYPFKVIATITREAFICGGWYLRYIIRRVA